jgi:hypothetical protein
MPPEQENKPLVWPYWPTKLRTSSSHEEGCERAFAIATKAFIAGTGEDTGRVVGLTTVNIEFQGGKRGDGASSDGEGLHPGLAVIPVLPDERDGDDGISDDAKFKFVLNLTARGEGLHEARRGADIDEVNGALLCCEVVLIIERADEEMSSGGLKHCLISGQAERAELCEVQIADRRAGVGLGGISVTVA